MDEELAALRRKLEEALREIGELHMIERELRLTNEGQLRAILALQARLSPGDAPDPVPLPNRAARRAASRRSANGADRSGAGDVEIPSPA